MAYSNKVRAEVMKALSEGMSTSKASQTYNISQQTICNWKKEPDSCFVLSEYPVLFIAPTSRVTLYDSFALFFAICAALGSYYLGGVEVYATYLFNKRNGIQFSMRFMIENDDSYQPKQFCLGYVHEF